MYISDKGRFVVTLFGLIKIADGKGPSFDQGELLRWLGESVCTLQTYYRVPTCNGALLMRTPLNLLFL
jgi:hypothetical protein